MTYFDNLADRVFTLYTVCMDQIEGHPIPQDITGFQFRLIGDMTVKQFAYLAAGVVIAFICFSLPIFFVFKVLIGGFFALCGVFLAFVPVEGRPADTMIMLFLSALLKPNEFSYKKTSAASNVTVTPAQVKAIEPEKKEETKNEKVFFTSNPPADITMPDDTTDSSNIDTSFADAAQPSLQQIPVQEPSQQIEPQGELKTETPVDQTTQMLQQELAEAKQEEKEHVGQPQESQAHEKVLDLEKQLQDMQSQKELLEQQLVQLQSKLQSHPTHVFTPTTASVPEETEHVKKIPQQLQKSTGVPFAPDVPNLITGVIKDPRGNVLPNILVEVKDKDQNPVRAFKTNQLGQFLSATPLLNGTYTITFEDPKKQQKFDTVEITADGSILYPLEVTSVDAREELRKSLFTAN